MSRAIDALLCQVVNAHGNERHALTERHAPTLRSDIALQRATAHVVEYERRVKVLKAALDAVDERLHTDEASEEPGDGPDDEADADAPQDAGDGP
jgi:hypothetical protein